MSDSASLPRAGAQLVDGNGRPTPEFFRFFRDQARSLSEQFGAIDGALQQLAAQQQTLLTILGDLSVIDGQIQGLGPLAVLTLSGSHSDVLRGDGTWGDATMPPLASYALTSLPAPAPGGLIYVTGLTGGDEPCFSDGAAWRRCSDRSIAS